jgi:hypothetical protein
MAAPSVCITPSIRTDNKLLFPDSWLIQPTCVVGFSYSHLSENMVALYSSIACTDVADICFAMSPPVAVSTVDNIGQTDDIRMIGIPNKVFRDFATAALPLLLTCSVGRVSMWWHDGLILSAYLQGATYHTAFGCFTFECGLTLRTKNAHHKGIKELHVFVENTPGRGWDKSFALLEKNIPEHFQIVGFSRPKWDYY